MDKKNYNSQRRKLILPEYGRHVHTMVQQLMAIEDRELRNREARAVIAVMGNINPYLRDTEDVRHKLWDHMFIMSDFRLDVDSPYEKPSPEKLEYHPRPLRYPKGGIRHKQYGQNVKNILQALTRTDNEEDKVIVAGNLAKYMKLKSYEYNKEFPSNEVIISDIREFSGNGIVLDDDILNNTKIAYKTVSKGKKAGGGKKSNNNNAKFHRSGNNKKNR